MAGGLKTRSGHIEGVQPWTVFGVSFYWASVIFQFLVPSDMGGPAAVAVGPAVRYALLAAFAGLGALAPRLYVHRFARRGLMVATLVCMLAVCAVPNASPAVSVLKLGAHMFSIASLMVYWGFAFASMDKRRAGQNVAAAALFSALIVLALIALSFVLGAGYLSRIAMAVSVCVALSDRVGLENAPHFDSSSTATQVLRPFVVSRVAFGLFMGFAAASPFSLGSGDVSWGMLVVGALALLCAWLMLGGSREKLYSALPAVLFLAVGVTYLPFFEGGLRSAAAATNGLVWLAWAALSGYQLSDVKERCGMGELGLCVLEKVVLSASIAMGALLFELAEGLFGTLPEDGLRYVLFSGTFALVLVSSNVMTRLVSARKDDEMRDRLGKARRERLDAAYGCVAERYGLSAREREVLEMLADGYTRSYIRDALGVSDGTAKAHIAHIYRKLDIHRRDELLEFVEKALVEVEFASIAEDVTLFNNERV